MRNVHITFTNEENDQALDGQCRYSKAFNPYTQFRRAIVGSKQKMENVLITLTNQENIAIDALRHTIRLCLHQ